MTVSLPADRRSRWRRSRGCYPSVTRYGALAVSPCVRSRTKWRRLRASIVMAAVALGTLIPELVLAQGTPARPLVFVRDVRIDSILFAFGVDSSRVRAAVVDAVRGAGRLATELTASVPSLDVDVTVPRSLNGGMFDPRGYVRVEVGRNLLEQGRTRSLVWQGMVDFPETPTWREFSRNTLAAVVQVVNTFLLSGVRGN